MEPNPYDPPGAEPTGHIARMKLSHLALALSIAGVSGLFVISWLSTIHEQVPFVVTIGIVVLTFSCIVDGLILGFVAAFNPPRRMAIWAALIGLFGAMHIPTFLGTFLHYLRN